MHPTPSWKSSLGQCNERCVTERLPCDAPVGTDDDAAWQVEHHPPSRSPNFWME